MHASDPVEITSRMCLRCAGEATLYEGDRDGEGNIITKDDLEWAYAFQLD